jgi:hypothetical protein
MLFFFLLVVGRRVPYRLGTEWEQLTRTPKSQNYSVLAPSLVHSKVSRVDNGVSSTTKNRSTFPTAKSAVVGLCNKIQ